jgi:hypothetical protein
MNFNPPNRYNPLTKINQNITNSVSQTSSKKKSISTEEWETTQWQNIPEVVQRAIASLLENQNRLTDQVGILEKKLTQQMEKETEKQVSQQERITDIVSKLGDEVQEMQQTMKSHQMDSQEGVNIKLRKFVLTSELERKIKEIHERIDKTNKIVKSRVGNEEFQRVKERFETEDLGLKRRMEEKADELDLISQKEDLERLIMDQMQKMGKLISENAIKVLRNSKEITKRVDEKMIHRLLANKIEAVRLIRGIWKVLLGH